MPFESRKQEAWMKHKKPKMYRKWLAEHGHYKGKGKEKSKKSNPFSKIPH